MANEVLKWVFLGVGLLAVGSIVMPSLPKLLEFLKKQESTTGPEPEPPATSDRMTREQAFARIEELRAFNANDPKGLQLINEAGKRLFDEQEQTE